MSFVILVLDLDDTLYDESTFVASGMAAVASFLARPARAPVGEIRERLMGCWQRRPRHTFDTLLADHG